jgi:hypothetical protein
LLQAVAQLVVAAVQAPLHLEALDLVLRQAMYIL